MRSLPPARGTAGGRFACSFTSLDGHDPIVSEQFSWGGGSWELVLFPHGYKQPGPGYASAYLRLAGDDRPLPLPRTVAFSITARDGKGGKELSRRSCGGHRFGLEPLAARSWGFGQFLEWSANGPSRSVDFEVALGPTLPMHHLPLGLVNNGNTCYMNSLLQSLFHVDAFREGLLALRDAGSLPRGGVADELALTFQGLRGRDSSGSAEGGRSGTAPARTSRLCQALGIDVRVQEDAQEFKGLLFMGLEDSMATMATTEGGSGFAALEAPFRGALQNRIACEEVGFTKTWREPFAELAVDVGHSATLEEALAAYFQDEVLDGENKYRTKEHGLQRAVKGARVLEAPEVLHVQLKRFAYGPRGLTKLGDRLRFGEGLDLTPFTAGGEARGAKYKLHAVMMHSGGAEAGHYYAYVRPYLAGRDEARWVKCDDVRVAEVGRRTVLTEGAGVEGGRLSRGSTTAYLLQYVREDAIPKLLHHAAP